MAYFQPMVFYRNPGQPRENSVVRYIGNRIIQQNKNFLCAVVGQTGSGKSWGCLGIAELYSKMHNIPFNPDVHVISSLKEMLELITAPDVDKKIRFGSVIVFDEPQIEANAREWQSEMNKALNQLVSTFRNQRLFVLFAMPFLSMIDKQSRILFHGEFKVLGFDKNTGETHLKPRFIEFNQEVQRFYKKRLIVEYKVANKTKMNIIKIHRWDVPKASDETLEIYEKKKKEFTDRLNKKLLNKILLSEKQTEGKDKASDFKKVRELYFEYGEDYDIILEHLPHLSPYAIEKFIQFVKKSEKTKKASKKHAITPPVSVST